MAGKKQLTIGDIIKEEDILPPVTALKNYLNKSFIIDELDKRAGSMPDENGDLHPWYLITARIPETDEVILLSCGASTVVKQLDAVNRAEHLPLQVTCVPHGTTRMIKLV